MHPALPLAISMHANRGVYALLLGSGVSPATEIPTGGDVTLDLIRKVARLRNESSDPYPAEWYETTYGSPPDYSQLLAQLAKTPPERSRLLRGYFEPTAAHRAIARLVKGGYVRVIVTTNFDRLLEHALDEVGVTPTVITFISSSTASSTSTG